MAFYKLVSKNVYILNLYCLLKNLKMLILFIIMYIHKQYHVSASFPNIAQSWQVCNRFKQKVFQFIFCVFAVNFPVQVKMKLKKNFKWETFPKNKNYLILNYLKQNQMMFKNKAQ